MIITVPGRVHLNLISMHRGGYRQNGSIGFCISIPSVVVEYKCEGSGALLDARSYKLPPVEFENLQKWYSDVRNEFSFDVLGDISLTGGVPPHIGLGSGTGTRLAILEILSRLSGLPFTYEQAIKLSGRGGASGVGLNTYFKGGFVMDYGRKSDGEFLRSSDDYHGVPAPPLVAFTCPMPEWIFGICVLRGKGTSIEDERTVFADSSRHDEMDTAVSLYHSVFGVQASILEADIAAFSSAVNAIQFTKWKSAEWGIQPEKVRQLAKFLHEGGAAFVALSSMGPTIVFHCSKVSRLIESASSRFLSDFIFLTVPVQNHGRTIAE